jgi:protein phosphatase
VDVEGPYPIQAGDMYLLCSDGLSGQVTDPEIGAIATVLPPAEACRFLVDLANLRGGPDNITVLIVRVNEDTGVSTGAENRKVPFYRRIPWPMYALFLGVFLAVAAGVLTKFGLSPYNRVAFLMATGSIIAGLVGLLILHEQERRRLAQQPQYPRPKVYRQSSCQVERSLVDKLAKGLATVQEQVREKQWETDWAAYQQHYSAAEGYLSQGKLADGFREYCRAMHLLGETLQRNRPKGEGFSPLWS